MARWIVTLSILIVLISMVWMAFVSQPVASDKFMTKCDSALGWHLCEQHSVSAPSYPVTLVQHWFRRLLQIIYQAVIHLLATTVKLIGNGQISTRTGSFTVQGISAPVQISRDEFGNPHVVAKNLRDALFAQGYVIAQDRTYQLELSRRLCAGRLSEIFGEKALATDKIARTLGFRRLGLNETVEVFDPPFPLETDFVAKVDVQDIMRGYLAGINSYISSKEFKRPIEFLLLGIRDLEPFVEEDITCWVRLQSFAMSKGFGKEISLSLLSNVFGNIAQDLDAVYGPNFVVEIETEDLPESQRKPKTQNTPDSSSNTNSKQNTTRKIETPPAHEQFDPDAATIVNTVGNPGGSNIFAISGKHTSTGKPFLLADPHLPLTIPSIWHQWSATVTEGEHANHWTGVASGLIPFFSTFKSNFISAGLTLGNIDVCDTYIVKYKLDQTGELHYEHSGKLIKADRIREQIPVKGSDTPVDFEIFYTKFGYLIDKVFNLHVGENGVVPAGSVPTGEFSYGLALKAVPLHPQITKAHSLLHGYIGYAAHGSIAKSCQEFQEATRLCYSPVLNLICADVEDNISHAVSSRVPEKIRSTSLPSKSWLGENTWNRLLTWEEMPRQFNPKKGYITSSNHRIVHPEDVRYNFGDTFAQGFRGTRLDNLISEAIKNDPVTLEQAKRIQQDTVSLAGLEFKERFFSYPNVEAAICGPTVPASHDKDVLCKALNIFKNWDGNMDVDSVGGSIYAAVYHTALIETLGATFHSTYLPTALGLGLHPVVSASTALQFSYPLNFFRMLDAVSNSTSATTTGLPPLSPDWIERVRGPESLLVTSFLKGTRWLAYYFLRETGTVEASTWRWGALHTGSFNHNLGAASRLFDAILSPKFDSAGDSDTVALSQVSPFTFTFSQVGFAVSLRQASDLQANGRYESILPPGNSGQYGSEHYNDALPLYLEGKLVGYPTGNTLATMQLVPQ